MKKSISYIIAILITAVITVTGTYMFMQSKNDNKLQKPSESTNSKPNSPEIVIGHVKTEKYDSNTVQSYEIKMNGNIVPVQVNFIYDELESYEEKIHG